MKYLIVALSLALFSFLNAQPNCEIFKYQGDSLKYQACQKAMEVYELKLNQFSKEYQMIMDEAIAIDPTFDYPYFAKSVAYLKSGDFLNWKPLIDKAVALNPKEHLGYRGWCRYQFFRDYEGAIKDIEKLDSLIDYNLGQNQNGMYHLNIAKGLCYKGIGEKEKAIEIIEKQIEANEKADFVGLNDYLHLGVLYLETEKWQKALKTFDKQSALNEIAENQYYKAMVYKNLNRFSEAKQSLTLAKDLYQKEQRLYDSYSNPMDKIFLEDIERELKKIN